MGQIRFVYKLVLFSSFITFLSVSGATASNATAQQGKKTNQRKLASTSSQQSAGATQSTTSSSMISASESALSAQGNFSRTSASSPSMNAIKKPIAFVDVLAYFPNNDTIPSRGFTLNEGALYFGKEFSRASAFIDLAFKPSINPADRSLDFSREQSQAHLHFQFESSILTLGQYDSFFGVEAEDSRDRFFAYQGAMAGILHPSTHTGLMVKFKNGDMIARAQLANPNGSPAMTTLSPELGGQLRLERGDSYGALGISIAEEREGLHRQSTLIDLMFGSVTSSRDIEFDFEVSLRKESGSDRQALGLGAFGNYLVDESLTWGARLEALSNLQGLAFSAGIIERITQFSVGPSYRFEPGLTFRGDLTYQAIKSTTSEQSTYALTASAVADF